MTTTAAERVEVACADMAQRGGPVPLPDLAARVHCSGRQLQRDFADVLGISPREYGQALRSERARSSLRSAPTVMDALFDAGYGSVRAFYEEGARRLGMTPSEYASGAPRRTLLWSVRAVGVGDILAVASADGLCSVRIGSTATLEVEMREEFTSAALIRDDDAMRDVMDALALLAAGRPSPRLPLDVHGTAFQARVWHALREIPAGETRTYTQVAEEIGSPTSVRAVARACATNPVALTVPCHRVIRSDGSLAGYRWGLEVKSALLAAESA